MHFTRADLHAWPLSQTQKTGLVYYNACTKSLDYTRTRDEDMSCFQRTAYEKDAWRYPVHVPIPHRTIKDSWPQ